MTAGEHGRVALQWIDDAWVDSPEHRQSVNPATGEGIGSYAMGAPEQAESAIAAAKRAFRVGRPERSVRTGADYADISTEAEAIAMADATEYGLSASVFSANVDVAMRVALAVEACSVWVNDWAKLHDQFEEGGFKASGVGRTRNLAVIDDFIAFKHIRLHPGDSQAAGGAS